MTSGASAPVWSEDFEQADNTSPVVTSSKAEWRSMSEFN